MTGVEGIDQSWKKNLPPPEPGQSVMDLGGLVAYGVYGERNGRPVFLAQQEFRAPQSADTLAEVAQAAPPQVKVFGEPVLRRGDGQERPVVQVAARFAGVVGPMHEPWRVFIGERQSRLVREADYESGQSKAHPVPAERALGGIALTSEHMAILNAVGEKLGEGPDADDARAFLARVALQLASPEIPVPVAVDNARQ